MYAVVGCSACDALWLLEDPGENETAECRRCGARHRTGSLRRLHESAGREAAREARAALLAERRGEGDRFADLESVGEMESRLDAAGVDDREFLAASGIDPDEVAAAGETPTAGGSRSRVEVVRGALPGTESEVIERAEAAGVPPDAARDLLAELRRRGEVTESGGRYRAL